MGEALVDLVIGNELGEVDALEVGQRLLFGLNWARSMLLKLDSAFFLADALLTTVVAMTCK